MKSPIRRRQFDDWTWPLSWAVVIVCLLLMFFAKPVHTLTNVYIAKAFADDPYYYCFNFLEGGHVDFCWHICKDYESPAADFLENKIFDEIDFIEMHGCKSLNPDSQAAYYERTVNGKPIFRQEKDEAKKEVENQGFPSPSPLTH